MKQSINQNNILPAKKKGAAPSIKRRTPNGVDAEFKKWLNKFMIEHDDVLRELAKH